MAREYHLSKKHLLVTGTAPEEMVVLYSDPQIQLLLLRNQKKVARSMLLRLMSLLWKVHQLLLMLLRLSSSLFELSLLLVLLAMLYFYPEK